MHGFIGIIAFSGREVDARAWYSKRGPNSHGGLTFYLAWIHVYIGSLSLRKKVRSNRLLTFSIYDINMSIIIISSNQSLCCTCTELNTNEISQSQNFFKIIDVVFFLVFFYENEVRVLRKFTIKK